MEETFQDRMFRGAEAVREAYERGEIQGADAVEAALMQAQVDASQED
ncbi:hypothetical protein [Streptomyces sp. NPDC006333]